MMREWLARRPEAFGVLGAVLLGWTAYRLFEVGMAAGGVRVARSELDRIASEALGG